MKSRVLLVFPPYIREAVSNYPPIGLSYIASYITSQNPLIKIRIIDFTIEKFSAELWKKELQTFKPEVVGISVLTLNYPGGALIARLTKQFDHNILVVMGGVHATMKPEECLNCCDIVVRGEGELTFYEILQDHELSTIRGASYWRDGRIVHNAGRERIRDLDDLPFPAHHLFKMERYKGFPSWGIMGSRGCPYNCIFCNSPQMWGRVVRYRSAKNIVDEIQYLRDKFEIQSIVFFDDNLNIPQLRAIEICNEIVRRNLHKRVSFVCQMRANRRFVSPKLFKKMKEANFVCVEFGIESGSERVLKSIRKSITLDEARRAVRMAQQAGIRKVRGFFMVGNWDESIWDAIKTWRFILSNDIEPSFSICMPLPGTEFYRKLTQSGYMSNDPNWSGFNQLTPIARTNKMSKSVILLVFVLSALLRLVIAFTRGERRRIPEIAGVALDILRGGLTELVRSPGPP